MKIQAPAAQTADEHASHGGSYVLDPATGRRQLMHRTGQAAAQPASSEALAAAAHPIPNPAGATGSTTPIPQE